MAPAASRMNVISKMERKFDLQHCIYKIRPYVKQLKENGDNCMCLIANSHCVNPCFNAVTEVECGVNCGTSCNNQMIRRKNFIRSLELFETPKMGYGVRTKVLIPKDTYVLEFTGECITLNDYKARLKTPQYKDTPHSYAVQLKPIFEMKKLPTLIIDAFMKGNLSRFINSSCLGNCEMRQISVDGIQRMTLWTTVDIPPNTELFYKYKFSYFENDKQFECLCGHINCITNREAVQDSAVSETELISPSIVCVLCNKEYDHISVLRRHQREVHGVTWIPTDEDLIKQQCHCGLILRYPSEMKKHVESHENKRSHICPKCKKGFKVNRNLQQHLQCKKPCVPEYATK